MTATGKPHWHREYYFPVFWLWTRHDEEGQTTWEILTIIGFIPIAVRKRL